MATMHCGSQGSSADFEAKFGSMLKPVKDLGKNWTIDLSKFLQDYLEQFVSQSGNSLELVSLPNFAQAAMLIQSSAHIYSKKVEYVYSLTYQLYEQLIKENNSKKKKQLAGSEDKEGRDGDVSASIHEQFLSLDDIAISQNLIRGPTGHRLSGKTTKTDVPTALIMLDDQEKGNSMLINIKGSQMGNRNDTSLNRCLLGSSGSLMNYSKDEGEINRGRSSVPPTMFFTSPLIPEDQDNDYDAGSVEPFQPGSPFPGSPPAIPVSVEKRNPRRQSRLGERILHNIQFDDPLDNLQLLDSHEEVGERARPLKEMRVHRPPPRLITVEPKRKRNRKKSAFNENVIKNGFHNMKIMDHSLTNKICFSHVEKFPKSHLKVPLLESIYDMYWDRRKQHLKQLKEMRKNRLHDEKDDDLLSDDDQENNEPIDNEGEDSLSDDEGGRVLLEDLPINQNDAQCERNLPDDDLFTGNRGSLPVVTTYEELAKEQIAKFLETNTRFQKGSEIGKRVSEWEERIQPYLEEEERRRPYDIHNYGSEILACFGDNNRKQTLPFAEIVSGKALWEIARYFLSSLFLANHSNVQISSNGILEQGMDTMELTLLSRKRHHEEMLEEFRANP